RPAVKTCAGGVGYSERRRAAGCRRAANVAGPVAMTAAAASVPAETAARAGQEAVTTLGTPKPEAASFHARRPAARPSGTPSTRATTATVSAFVCQRALGGHRRAHSV